MNECIIEISRDNANLGRSITVGVCLDGGEVGTLKTGKKSVYPRIRANMSLHFTDTEDWIKPFLSSLQRTKPTHFLLYA